jgi:hypothetical protein
MGDDRKGVQPYPVELWPETCPVVGRSSSFNPLYPHKEPYPVAVVLGRGKQAKFELARTNWGESQGKLLGDQVRKEWACRGLDIRAAHFVPRLSKFQASEFHTKDRMLLWSEEVLAGETAKPARERHRGEGNSPLWRRGGPPCHWLGPGRARGRRGPLRVGEAVGRQCGALAAHPRGLSLRPRTILSVVGGPPDLARIGALPIIL